jgi:hypothetical protein
MSLLIPARSEMSARSSDLSNAQDQRRASTPFDKAEASYSRPLHLDVIRHLDRPDEPELNKKRPLNQ